MNMNISTEFIDKMFNNIEPVYQNFLKENKNIKVEELEKEEFKKLNIMVGKRFVFLQFLMEIFTTEHQKSKKEKNYELCEYLFQKLRDMGVSFDVQ